MAGPKLLLITIGVCVSLTASAGGALGQVSKGVPASAPRALASGLKAAASKDWKEAIRQFNLAQDRAPESPAVLYNLGLAHDAADHKLAAAAWFHADLAADQRATDAAHIRKEIGRLKAATRADIDKIENLAVESAEKDTATRGASYMEICLAHAELGEIDRALAVALRAGIQLTEEVWVLYAYYLIATNGDSAGAQAAMTHVTDTPSGQKNEFARVVRSEISKLLSARGSSPRSDLVEPTWEPDKRRAVKRWIEEAKSLSRAATVVRLPDYLKERLGYISTLQRAHEGVGELAFVRKTLVRHLRDFEKAEQGLVRTRGWPQLRAR